MNTTAEWAGLYFEHWYNCRLCITVFGLTAFDLASQNSEAFFTNAPQAYGSDRTNYRILNSLLFLISQTKGYICIDIFFTISLEMQNRCFQKKKT